MAASSESATATGHEEKSVPARRSGVVLATVLGTLAGLACLAFMALETYSAYKHWGLPVNQRGHDVWGSMCVVAGIGMIVTGAFTITVVEDWL